MPKRRKKQTATDKVKSCVIYNHASNVIEEELNKTLKKLRADEKIASWCYVLHDRDKYSYVEQEENSEHIAGTLKTPHYHVWLQLPANKGRKREDIAKWLNVGWSMVRDLEYVYEKAIVYATHALNVEKAQYAVDEVVCSADINFSELVQKRVKEYQETTRKSLLMERRKEIMDAIENGKINKLNMSKMLTSEEELTHGKAITVAMNRYERELQQKTERNMTCIYITGASRACKTSLAKKICESLKLTYNVAGAKDPSQFFMGQEATIIDDLGVDTMGWKELLNLTDNDTATPVASRFKNKLMFCKLLIVTANIEPYQLANALCPKGEDKNQLYRRFKQYYKADYNYITEYNFNDDVNVMKYEEVNKMTNYAVPIMAKKKAEKEEKRIHICLSDIMARWVEEEGIIILDTVRREPKKQKTPKYNKDNLIYIQTKKCTYCYKKSGHNYTVVSDKSYVPKYLNQAECEEELKASEKILNEINAKIEKESKDKQPKEEPKKQEEAKLQVDEFGFPVDDNDSFFD
ncbi:MAG: hypothetical protein HFG41_01165 [Coprococcus sp.]|nr:hypothetical protein [Coprococcus sp.]